MTDNTLSWVVPAITLGYAVKQDPDGRLHFFNDDVDIVYRHHHWVATDRYGLDEPRSYDNIQDALQNEYVDTEEAEITLSENTRCCCG